MTDVTVIGAGISGLATAWYLTESRASVTVIDAAPGPGGLIRTIATPHGPVETAANAFVQTAQTDALFDALDLRPLTPRPSSRNRYIFRNGRAHKWPLTVGETTGMATRLAAAWISRRTKADDDETVAQWGARVIGRTATDWLLGPALHGIYGSSPDALSARAIADGRTKGRRRFVAPPEGMGQFVERLHRVLVERGVVFRFGTPVNSDAIVAGQPTVVATNARSAARLLEPHAPAFARASAAVQVPPMSLATAFFAPHRSDLEGFGVLFPRASGVAALGVRFNTEIFDNRGDVRSETWIYAGAVDDASFAPMLRADRAQLTGHDSAFLDLHTTVWSEAIPVYGRPVQALRDVVTTLPPWLAITGNYLGRLGVAQLLDLARESAARLTRPA